MDDTEKYTDIRVILAELSSGMADGTENRRNKVHTLQLEGYRKFDFMLLHAHGLENAATMYKNTIMCESCEISYHFLTCKRHFQWKLIFSLSVRSSIVQSCNSYSV